SVLGGLLPMSSFVGTLQPSILIAPVPYFSTLSATVPSSGLRTIIIGSWAGFSAVPQPSHFLARSVAGAVISYPSLLGRNTPLFFPSGFHVLSFRLPLKLFPITSRTAPARLSNAFPTLRL